MKAQGDVHLVGYRHLILDLPAGLVNFECSLMGGLQELAKLTNHSYGDEYLLRRFDGILAKLGSSQPEASLEACIELTYSELRQELGLCLNLPAAQTFARQASRWQVYEDVPGALLYLRNFFTLSVLCPPRYQPLVAAISGVRFLEGELSGDIRVDSRVPALFIGGRQALSPQGADWCFLRRESEPGSDGAGAVLTLNSLQELVAMHQSQLSAAGGGVEGRLP